MRSRSASKWEGHERPDTDVQRRRSGRDDTTTGGCRWNGAHQCPVPVMLYFGGKSRWIDLVFARIGKVGVWSEPLCGTAVMTLNNPFPAPREVICELNAYIANFYRATVADYEATAYWADWPTNHHDLTARHRWLLAQGPELRERMVADPDDFDAKIAGWWVWGQSSWIGHGWCDASAFRDGMPVVPANGNGGGVQIQRRLEDKRPKVPDGGGSGVSAQRTACLVTRYRASPSSQAAGACSSSGTRYRTWTPRRAGRASACSGWR